MRSFYIVSDLHVCVNNINALSVVIEILKKFHLYHCRHTKYYTLLSKMYRHLCWYVKCPISMFDINAVWLC